VAGALLPTSAFADERYFGADRPAASYGFDLGVQDLARLGNSVNADAPQGDAYLQAGAHYWIRHIVELNLKVGYGFEYGELDTGIGAKINLFEIYGSASSRTILKEIPGFGDTGLHKRGLLAGLLGDFMVYAALSGTRYQFQEPKAAQSYPSSGWVAEPGLGAQFYLGNIARSFSRRWYLDLSLTANNYAGSYYLAPRVGVGFELK
jgi:hypothetical protein